MIAFGNIFNALSKIFIGDFWDCSKNWRRKKERVTNGVRMLAILLGIATALVMIFCFLPNLLPEIFTALKQFGDLNALKIIDTTVLISAFSWIFDGFARACLYLHYNCKHKVPREVYLPFTPKEVDKIHDKIAKLNENFPSLKAIETDARKQGYEEKDVKKILATKRNITLGYLNAIKTELLETREDYDKPEKLDEKMFLLRSAALKRLCRGENNEVKTLVMSKFGILSLDAQTYNKMAQFLGSAEEKRPIEMDKKTYLKAIRKDSNPQAPTGLAGRNKRGSISLEAVELDVLPENKKRKTTNEGEGQIQLALT